MTTSKNTLLWRAGLLAGGLLAAATLQADVRLPAIFSDHVVLQRAANVPVWGWADAGETVRVTVGDASAETRADANGRWLVKLNLANAAQGPYKAVVKGNNEIVINDVVTGQVWLASGQSNMDWRLKQGIIGADEENAAGAGSFIREFTVPRSPSTEVQEDVKGKWIVAEPGQTGEFSAVAYYFAKELHRELKQPVGIVCSSWGGSALESWVSLEAIASDKTLAEPSMRYFDEVSQYPKLVANYWSALVKWIQGSGTADAKFADAQQFAAPDADTSDWKKTGPRANIKDKSQPVGSVLWLRRNVTLPATAANKPLNYDVAVEKGFPTFYWNGQRVSGPEYWSEADIPVNSRHPSANSRVRIPANLVKAGENVLAIRIYAPTAVPSFGKSNQISGAGGFNQQIQTQWIARVEKDFALSQQARKSAPVAPNRPRSYNQLPSMLFNGMIAPLVPYGIAGVIWYQGETNASRAHQYRTSFPLLINDWRSQWQAPELPFYFCQLANFRAKQAEPGDSDWAELREAQNMTLSLPHTGQAVLIDIGESEDIHPRNKHDVGARLARLALANDYGRSDIVAVGPTFERQSIEGNKIRLVFKNAGAGSELVARDLPKLEVLKSIENKTAPLQPTSPGSQLQGFAICGADGKWVWAQAEIDGKHSVIVSSPQVPNPVAIRYAWADNPTCNLYNAAGLPASPFRTDDFQPTTVSKQY